MKHLQQFWLAVLASLACTITANAYDFMYNGLYYKITSTWNSPQNTCEVTYGPSGKGSYNDVSDYTLEDVVIPEGVAYNGTRYLVTTIGNYAFTNCSTIKSLTIEGNVYSIGEHAFYNCKGLESVQLNESVKILKKFAFCGCNQIKSLSMPCIESIGDYALSSIYNLTTLKLPATLKEISLESALYDMYGLEYIDVSADNQYFCSIDGILFNKDKTMFFKFPEKKQIEEYCVPDGVTEILPWSFSHTSLKTIKLSNTVKKIKKYAFRENYYLTDIDLGHSVEEIGHNAFGGCSIIRQIVIPNSVTKISNYCFNYAEQLETVVFGESLQSFDTSFTGTFGYNCPVKTVVYLMKTLPTANSSLEIPSTANVFGRRNLAKSYSSYFRNVSSFDYFSSNYKPRKGTWYESNNDFTGLYCVGDTLFAFSGNYKKTKPSDMKDYASKSDYKYNPSAEFYNHNYCVALDFSKSGVRASDFVGKKISGAELIGTPVSNLDECGIPCFTIYTTPRLEFAREGDEFNMNTYRVINFAYPADDGKGYPYYLIQPVIGERCKVTGTYNSAKGGFYDSSLNFTVKVRGAKGLENNKTYTLEGIVRYVTTNSSYTGGDYVLDASGDISFDYEISKQPTEDDLSVELNKPNSQVTYQWYNGADESVIPNATNNILKELDGLKVGDVVFCEVTFSNGRVLRSDRVTLTNNSLDNSRTITYIVNGKEFKTEKYNVGSTINAPEPPVIEGFTFVRWENLPNVMPVNDMTVTAVYKEYKCKIYKGNRNVVNSRYSSLGAKPASATAVNALIFVDETVSEKVGENFVMKGMDNCWEAKDILLTDAQPFYCPEDVNVKKISYKRSFSTKNWQALYLPFSLSYDEWKDKVQVAYFNNVHQYDTDGDGKIDKTTIEFFTQTGGELKANTPYLVKALNTGEVTLTGTDKVLKATPEEEGFVDCMSTSRYYSICGIYQTKTDLFAKGQYAVSGGAFNMAANSSATVPPFRIYLNCEDRSGNGSMAKVHSMAISVDGEETTGVEGIFGEEDGAVYDLRGIRHDKPVMPGIYIRNGKKTVIK